MPLPRNDWVDAEELTKRELNKLRGKLCSLIETMDLDGRTDPLSDSQERAVIALAKQMTYDTQEVLSQVFAHIDNSGMQFRYSNDRLEVR